MKRKRYQELYDLRTVTDPYTGKERKEALYRGPYYRLLLPSREKRKRDLTLALLLIAALLLFLACGLSNPPGSHCFYVLPFFLFMSFPLFYACMAAFRFFRLPSPFTRIQKEESMDSLLHSCVGLMVLSGLYALGDAVLMALGGAADGILGELLALAGVLGIGALAAILRGVASVETAECQKDGEAPA